MIWDGTTVYTDWNYRPLTELALKWHQRADTNWRGSDRTLIEDVYGASVVFRGPESEMNSLETVLNNNRSNFDASFNAGEQIFGADVEYSGDLSVIVTEYGKINQVDFDVWEIPLTLRLLDPTFSSVTPDFSRLRTASHSTTRQTEFEIRKSFTYDGDVFLSERLSNDGLEAGMFTATFEQTNKEMAAIRRYLSVTARANLIPFPDFGNITEPFGPRAGTGPFNCRVVKWKDLGRKNLLNWGLSITFAREIQTWNSLFDNVIIETGAAPDTIIESGSQPDTIVEVLGV